MNYPNSTVLHDGTAVAKDVSVDVTEDGSIAVVSGGKWSAKPTVGAHYLLTDHNQLDWTGTYQSHGAAGYRFTVSD